MISLQEAVDDFLAQELIAVTGVSRTREDAANNIYRRLKETGHQVFAVNPNTDVFDGDPCYPDLKSIPNKPDAVVVVNRQDIAEQICHECSEIGVTRVWMHRSMEMLGSSVSDPAVEFCRENNIMVIPGGCPMMFCGQVDFGHKFMRWMLNLTGKLPKEV